MTLQDLGGQPELHSLWESYYSDAHGVMYVIDSTDHDRLEESKNAFERMVENKLLQGVPLLVICNKQDKEDAMDIPSIKRMFNRCAHKLGVRDCKVINGSGHTGQGEDVLLRQ